MEHGLGVVTNAVLAGAFASLVGLAVAVVGSGIYIAIEETIEKSAVAELLPRERRSFGFGILACANAIGDMVSSLYVGALLAAGHGRVAFALAATFGVLGLGWVVVVGGRSAVSERQFPKGTSYRVVKAALHKLAADIELATPANERWCVNTEDFNKSGRVYLELSDATPAEAERGMALLKKLVG